MSELLARAQLYINYQNKLIVDWGKEVKIPNKKGDKIYKYKKGPRGNYVEYTPLNTTRERFLNKCIRT
jgi:hypothetical protein